jgi:alpha-mannosidase
MNHAAFFLGVGDHGGAVTAEQVREITQTQSNTALPELRWSTVRQFFEAVRQEPGFATLPVLRGELQHHSRGCYSAYGEGKFQNRRAERSLVDVETISAITSLAAAGPYPSAQYAEAWWKVLFCQFHDMLSGTALYGRSSRRTRQPRLCLRDCPDQQSAGARNNGQASRYTQHQGERGLSLQPAALAAQSSAGAAHRPNPDRLGIITYLATSDGARVPIQFLPPDSMTIGVPRLTAMVDLLAAATPSSSWPAAMGPPAQRSPAALYHPRPA